MPYSTLNGASERRAANGMAGGSKMSGANMIESKMEGSNGGLMDTKFRSENLGFLNVTPGPQSRHGSIEVIVGSMFSGKTEELIRLLRRAEFARQNVQVFKPVIDDRYSKDHVASHSRLMMAATAIQSAAEIYHHLKPDTKIIGIDEGQFFDSELVDVVNDLADRGLRVIVAGLDMDWRGEPFHPMPELMAIAETCRKLQAVCVICGATASRTQRVVASSAMVLVGDNQSYESRCRSCFDIHLATDNLITDETLHGQANEFSFE